MKYNRAFIIRNEKSLPTLEEYNNGEEEDEYWLFESGESFHGEYDDEFFYFKDLRLDGRLKLPLDCVELEFTEEEVNAKT